MVFAAVSPAAPTLIVSSPMTYRAPVTEQRFVLDHVVRIADLAEHAPFAEASPEMVDAIVDGIAAVAGHCVGGAAVGRARRGGAAGGAHGAGH